MKQDEGLIARLAALKSEHAEVQASLPKHSVPASMLLRLEDLQEQIEELEAQLARYPDRGQALSD